jgi:hypothetical protein
VKEKEFLIIGRKKQTSKKEIEVNKRVAIKKRLREAKKCIVVCFNCHAELHAGYKSI